MEVGQTWVSADPRFQSSTVRVVRIEDTVAVCDVVAAAGSSKSPWPVGRTRSIKLDRFRPGTRGYRLLQIVDEEGR